MSHQITYLFGDKASLTKFCSIGGSEIVAGESTLNAKLFESVVAGSLMGRIAQWAVSTQNIAFFASSSLKNLNSGNWEKNGANNVA